MGAARSRVPDPEKVIMETFREAGYVDGWTETVLADYVHELTEKAAAEMSGCCFICDAAIGVMRAAIDPDVES